MSERVVVDASTVLMVLNDEPGADAVLPAMQFGIIGAVNAAEVVTRLIDRGLADAEASASLSRLQFELVPFDGAMALDAARLRSATRAHGLSLGDRACLALARARKLPVLTADRAWAALDLGIDIRVVR